MALNLSLSFPFNATPPFLADLKNVVTTLCCPSSRLSLFFSTFFQKQKVKKEKQKKNKTKKQKTIELDINKRHSSQTHALGVTLAQTIAIFCLHCHTDTKIIVSNNFSCILNSLTQIIHFEVLTPRASYSGTLCDAFIEA